MADGKVQAGEEPAERRHFPEMEPRLKMGGIFLIIFREMESVGKNSIYSGNFKAFLLFLRIWNPFKNVLKNKNPHIFYFRK